MDADQAVKWVIETIRDQYQPEKIILFGSRIWGTPHRDSDLDVLVIKETDVRELDRMREVSRLLTPRHLPLDILVKTPDEIRYRIQIGDSFIRDILARGRVVYDRSVA